MSIENIDYELCIGCGTCVDSCWADIIRMDENDNKPIVRYPEDCVSCRVCKNDCSESAIEVSSTMMEIPLTLWGVFDGYPENSEK